ncbi:MAG: hypothetical protein M5U28_37475 [Sandaracinaceae bacterium]|nr:hypothetical protein [Sandaracinaceae bacterium]
MSEVIGRSGPAVITSSAEGCMLAYRGAVVGIRRAPVDARYLANLYRAVATASAAGPGKAVMMTAYRLSPDFPIDVTHTWEAEEYLAPLREIDRAVAAYAMLVEFGGLRAIGMRAVTRAVWSLARPRAALGTFDRLADAIAWLAPRAQLVGALDEPAEYVRLYRTADRILDGIDAEARR